MIYRAIIVFLLSLFLFSSASAQICVDCHKTVTPNIVSHPDMKSLYRVIAACPQSF
jgi:hypothetical protein